MDQSLALVLKKYRDQLQQVVPFEAGTDKLVSIDLSISNTELEEEVYQDTNVFSLYIDNKLAAANAKFAIGGYLEKRVLYKRSALFETLKAAQNTAEPAYQLSKTSGTIAIDAASQRSMHLGTDIWGAVHTPVFAPLDGVVHSFAFNQQFGDYGATLILQHQLDGLIFHTLYGHISQADLQLSKSQFIAAGETVGHFGPPEENGFWPPHLHFQLIKDMELQQGDYPGVCHVDDLAYYQTNCPDPDMVLQLNKWIDQ